MIKTWELQDAIIDTVELYCRDTADYYALNHISDADLRRLTHLSKTGSQKMG